MGFRPEHVQVLDRGAGTATGVRLDATVAVKEWLGAELLLHFDIPPGDLAGSGWSAGPDFESPGGAAAKLIARVDRTCDVEEGGEVTLCVDAGRVLFFDPASGRRLG